MPFTCGASGDTWTIEGTSTHKVACALRCILRDATGSQDVVTCSPTIPPGSRSGAVCEGFMLGKHWISATLVAAECAGVE